MRVVTAVAGSEFSGAQNCRSYKHREIVCSSKIITTNYEVTEHGQNLAKQMKKMNLQYPEGSLIVSQVYQRSESCILSLSSLSLKEVKK